MYDMRRFILSCLFISLAFAADAQFEVFPNGRTLVTANVANYEPALRVRINNIQGTSYDLNVGTNPGCFYVRGDGWVYATTGYGSGSDQRLKKNLSAISNPLSLLLQLSGVAYYYKSPEELSGALATEAVERVDYESLPTAKADMRMGLLAQDVQELLPGLVQEAKNGSLSIVYADFIPLLIEGIKAQQAQIAALEERLEQLENRRSKMGDEVGQAGRSAQLFQNRPNPFSEQTVISYDLGSACESAQIYIHSPAGSQIMVLELEANSKEVVLEAAQLKAGMYTYTLVVNGQMVETKRMILQD